MLVSIVAIGNSKGIRIPKTILEQLRIEDKVEMEIDENRIILKPAKENPRAGWSSAFKNMHNEKDDALLIPESVERDDFQWEW